MSENTNLDSSTSLLEVGDGEEKEAKGWWKKVLDLGEAKNQVLYSLPMILTNVFYYSITLISVMFAGHLGELQLAGASLADTWATVSGFASMIGLSGALDTLCGQGFGARLYRMLGIYLQASCIIAKEAALYIKFPIPGLFAYAFLQNILRFLQTQSVVMPLVVFSGIPLVINAGLAYAFVHRTALGFKGAALAASISLWLSVIMMSIYVTCSKKFEHTWKGFSLESLNYILLDLKLALPSAAMVCVGSRAFEIILLLAGLMQDPEITTSLIAMCGSTETICYMVAYGLSAAASTRVSNELGAGNPDRAKNAMAVILKLCVFLALILVLAVVFGHNIWASFYSDNSTIIKEFASLTPLLAISIFFDFMRGVLSGVARGCGLQHLVVYVNFAAFYFIGVPIAFVLGFKSKLQVKGLWIGEICGLASQAVTLLLITVRTKWRKVDLPKDINEENPVLV